MAQVDEEQQGVEVEVTDEQGKLLHKGVAHSDGAALDVGRPPAASSARRPGFREKYGALLPFAIISSSYLLFTITDGAVRMIVLLHGARQQGVHSSTMPAPCPLLCCQVARGPGLTTGFRVLGLHEGQDCQRIQRLGF